MDSDTAKLLPTSDRAYPNSAEQTVSIAPQILLGGAISRSAEITRSDLRAPGRRSPEGAPRDAAAAPDDGDLERVREAPAGGSNG